MTLSDQADRERFAGEIGRNFSVIAPAGVGKTTAIAKRLLQIAREDERGRAAGRAPRLPRLVVVTYTRKAADEMRLRARREIVEAGLEPRVLGWFNEAFFGTIHSFCFDLLRRFGPLAGLPTRFTVESDDTALRLAFQRDTPDVAADLPESARGPWRRYGSAAALWPLVFTWSAAALPPAPGPCPPPELAPIFSFQRKKKHPRAEAAMARAREHLRRWQAAPADARALGIPAAQGGGEEFQQIWADAFLPLRNWLAAAAAFAAARLAEKYASYKVSQGRLRYDDFVHLAGGLLRDPVLAARIREMDFSVLLDEAQDTDPGQFAVLVGVAQPARIPGLWTEGAGAPPEPGKFSMVGDPQQGIFDRADVREYLELHRRLVDSAAAEALTFSVTMRCDQTIVAGVNATFPHLLNGRRGQANFVPLQARPAAGPGAIWRLDISRPPDWPAKAKAEDRTRAEATALARWLARAGPAGVGAADWSQVAILAPRKHWLEVLAVALDGEDLHGQLHSSPSDSGADPARVWLSALLGVLADPADDFETVGVLREIFGVSDDEIFHWRKNSGGAGVQVASVLALLADLRRAIVTQPLRQAIAQVVATVQLRERLAALAVAPDALELLLDQALLAEARGETLAGFARDLRRGPAEAGAPAARPGEVQLLTIHKAKGLEWPAVILFGLFRNPAFAPPGYPMWLAPAEPGRAPECLYDKFHAGAQANQAGSWKAALDERRRAEFERLLYVSATRPRRTLMAVNASSLNDKCEGTLADVMGLLPGGSSHAWWESLPRAEFAGPRPAAASGEPPLAETVLAETMPWPAHQLPELDLARARARAEKFPLRIRPSTLARHHAGPTERSEPDLATPPDYPEDQPPPTAAMNYGNWWHNLMEQTPWNQGSASWARHWENALAGSPDPTRAREEINLLRAAPLAARLAAPGLEFVAEMPFLWAEPDGTRAYDGCMDLMVWDAAHQRWLVIDWKTDQVGQDPAAELRHRYGPQVEVYTRVLKAVTAAPVAGLLYSTRTGMLVAL